MYPPNKRKMLLRDEGDPHLVMIDLSKTPILVWKSVALNDAWARAGQLIGNNQILGGRINGYEVYDYNTGAIVKSVTAFNPSESAYRTVTGETMLTRPNVLTFLDKNDKVSHQILAPATATSAWGARRATIRTSSPRTRRSPRSTPRATSCGSSMAAPPAGATSGRRCSSARRWAAASGTTATRSFAPPSARRATSSTRPRTRSRSASARSRWRTGAR